MMQHETLGRTLAATAQAMSALGAELESTFVERDLQGILVVALEAWLRSPQVALRVRPNFRVKLAEWPGVGPVDVSLVVDKQEDTPVAFLELKWGAGTLYNCVWDLAKMGVAVARNHTPAAYLIAGAPAADWESAAGAELFEARDWSAVDLLVDYREYWDFWRGDVKTHPVTLPARLRTSPVADVPLLPPLETWRLRCVEVLAPEPHDWITVAGAADAALGGLRERMAWKPGDVEILTAEEAEERLGFRPGAREAHAASRARADEETDVHGQKAPEAARQAVVREVADEWMAAGRLHISPDDTSGDDDLGFWAEVDRRLR